ncbi:MAG: ATP-binding cassette domain-containing protein [Bacteroidales bacterium]|nr:ATP-binding cassette domain-containing protein [Bacteroidales bacterium]
MTESTLKALMRLFALVAQVHSAKLLPEIRQVVDSYLRTLVRPENIKQYLIMFEFYHNSLREREYKTGQKQLSLFSVKAIIICEEVNKELAKKLKIKVLLSLIEILNISDTYSNEAEDFLKTLSTALHFDENLLLTCLLFTRNQFEQIEDSSNILIVDNGRRKFNDGFKHIEKQFLKGYLAFFYIKSADTYLFRHIENDDKLYYNGQLVELDRTMILQKGSAIKNPLIGSILYSDIVRTYYYVSTGHNIHFTVEQASFRFKDSENGIMPFNLNETSGQLIGIMGGSGVGKSTLLNLLNGNLKPKQGRVLINGFNIHEDKEELKGIVGFVPQDDLLIEELTVFQNLYYNAKLCFNNLSEDLIYKRVQKVLYELDLYEARNLTVGNPLNKFISGGQRKRLNIALELIREPYVLFVDEPTSGLSSTDSDIVIDLLKEQSLKGKLVIINIHQPSSDIFKNFDKLILMDKGGRMVYHGNPLEALVYLRTYNQLVNASDGECPTCGNVNPEQGLEILEAKNVNEFGEYLNERKVSAQEWYVSFKNNLEQEINQAAEIKTNLPKSDFQIPGKFKQFKIFGIRNLLSKLADKQYMVINLLEAPVLAFILAWFTKYKAGLEGNPDAYVFSENINLPVYIFMVPIVALFLGLMVAAEDIIRDRKIIQREQFLNLNIRSYFNAKVVFLMFLSAIQSLLFIGIGNYILQIKGMFFEYWLFFFITSLFANMLSLNISATLKSVVAIYILIPILLVPQILLGGAMIQFDKINSTISHHKYVPFIGDIMASRWAYEALAVYQFKNNEYKKRLYEIELDESRVSYMMNYQLPEIQSIISETEYNIRNNVNRLETRKMLELLSYEMGKLEENLNLEGFDIGDLKPEGYNLTTSRAILKYINTTRQNYSRKLDQIIDAKDKLILDIQNELGTREDMINFIRDNHNLRLEEFVLNKKENEKLQIRNNQIIQKYEPIFLFPESKLGRAHMFAPYKRIGNYYIETYWFNFMVMFLFMFLFYIALLVGFFPRLFNFIQSYHLRKKLVLMAKQVKEILTGKVIE